MMQACNWSMNKHFGHLWLLRPDEHRPNAFCAAFGCDSAPKCCSTANCLCSNRLNVKWFLWSIVLGIMNIMCKTMRWQLFNMHVLFCMKSKTFVYLHFYSNEFFLLSVSNEYLSVNVTQIVNYAVSSWGETSFQYLHVFIFALPY